MPVRQKPLTPFTAPSTRNPSVLHHCAGSPTSWPIRESPSSLDHYEDDWHALWWVRADGTGRVLDTNDPESRDAIERLAVRYPQYRGQPPRGPVVAIDVTRWSSWSASGD